MRSSTALMVAASLLLLLVSLAAADIEIPYRERSEEETRKVFVEWKAKYGKTYNSIGEEERRYATFKNTLRNIDQHNAAGIPSYRLRWQLNNFSDHTHGEGSGGFRSCYLPAPLDGDWTSTKGALIAYMLFVSSFIVLIACCKLHA
ncbi:hypothetical protein ZWY2020_000235 [Hordeum vulgare]|nr:hypothetical protein ZWY2020_000235 [Hordeum vulgare]